MQADRQLSKAERQKLVASLVERQRLGTLAGDDTCLVVAQDARRARQLARELSRAIG